MNLSSWIVLSQTRHKWYLLQVALLVVLCSSLMSSISQTPASAHTRLAHSSSDAAPALKNVLFVGSTSVSQNLMTVLSKIGGYQPSLGQMPATTDQWKDFSLVVLALPMQMPSANQLQQLQQYIQTGGSLLVIGEYEGFSDNSTKAVNAYLQPFGMKLGGKVLAPNCSTATDHRAQVVTPDLGLPVEATILIGASNSIVGGTSFVDYQGNSILSTKLVDKGRIAAFGDSSVWLCGNNTESFTAALFNWLCPVPSVLKYVSDARQAHPEKKRSLIFVNNPEMLRGTNSPAVVTPSYKSDLADDGSSIYTDTLNAGYYRDIFTHINGVTDPKHPKEKLSIGYSILIFNPTKKDVTFTTEAAGFDRATSIIDDSTNWGEYLAKLLNAEESQSPSTMTLKPGEQAWLLQEDAHTDSTGSLGDVSPAPLQYGLPFAGAVDFSVNGSVKILHVAYTSTKDKPEIALDASKLAYEGIVKRVDRRGSTNCPAQPPVSLADVQRGCRDTSRMFKGKTDGISGVIANPVNFVVSDQDKGKILPVQFPQYEKQSNGTFAPSTTMRQSDEGWYSNIQPANTYPAVYSDMLAFHTPDPDNLTIDPLKPSDPYQRYPSAANWGVTYTITGVVSNTSATQDLTLAFRLKRFQESKSWVVYKTSSGAPTWKAIKLSDTGEIIGTVMVPKGDGAQRGTARYSFTFVLSSPGGGPIIQDLEILNS